VTGGAGLYQGPHIGRFLADALGGPLADVAVLAGATMTIDRPAPGVCEECDSCGMHCPGHSRGDILPRPGVMEVLVELAAMGAPARTIGIVPTIGDAMLYNGYIVISNEADNPYYTVVDDRCPVCLMLQFSTDKPKLTWFDEALVSIDYMEILRNDADYESLHLVFNGGNATRQECEHVAALPQGDNPWKILLVSDADRVSTELAADPEFRRGRPQIESCTQEELPLVLQQMDFAPVPNSNSVAC
jgi:hypothetical protein